MNIPPLNIPNNPFELLEAIKKMAQNFSFIAVGCVKAERLDEEIERYQQMQKSGYFGKMDFLSRNEDKRFDPTLLVEGAKSILVFLAPFEYQSNKEEKQFYRDTEYKVSEYAYGADYHTVIKEKLNTIAYLIDLYSTNRNKEEKDIIDTSVFDNLKRYKPLYSKVFSDSAPVMERAWAVRAGLGFIGYNNFLISKNFGVKNFLATIITKVELPYNKQIDSSNYCKSCKKCLQACTQGALFAPYKIDARKCLSYKTIEEPLVEISNKVEIERKEKNSKIRRGEKWIFGCDDCMNACPYNKFNIKGWEEFHSNAQILNENREKEWWLQMTEEDFNKIFKNSPLQRAGLKKIQDNINRDF